MTIVCLLLNIYLIILVVRMVLSFFPLDPDGGAAAIAGFLLILTDPVLLPLRRVIPPLSIGSVRLDLSPLIVFIGIQILIGAIC